MENFLDRRPFYASVRTERELLAHSLDIHVMSFHEFIEFQGIKGIKGPELEHAPQSLPKPLTLNP